MSLPNFLCIGAQKAGTSWLNNVLVEHPHVFMPPVNELHFFDRMDRGLGLRKRQIKLARKAINHEKRKRHEANQAYIEYLEHLSSFPEVTIDWYRAAYAWPVADDVKKGDITPSYLDLPEETVVYARELLGPAKLVLIIRRPIDRLLSQLRMWVTRHDNNWEPQNEREWMDLLLKLTAKESRAAYSRGVPVWRKHFGAENLLIVPFSDIRTDPRGTISRVEDHIGVPHFDGFTLLDTKIHVTKKYEIPDSVRQKAAEFSAAEEEYIRKEFGEEFLEKTR